MKKSYIIIIFCILIIVLIPCLLSALLPPLQDSKSGNTIEIESTDALFLPLKQTEYSVSFKGTLKHSKTEYKDIDDFYSLSAIVDNEKCAYIIFCELDEIYDLDKYVHNRWLQQQKEQYSYFKYDGIEIVWTYYDDTSEYYAVFNYSGNLYEIRSFGDCDQASFLSFVENFI